MPKCPMHRQVEALHDWVRVRDRRVDDGALQHALSHVGRIRLRRVKDVSADSLLPFVQGAVVTGATIHTDGWSGYAGLKAAGYKHRVSVISVSSDPAHEAMPRVHTVASLLKR